MSILSFDIGIKNLCYCELSSDKNILDWKIIDISNDVPCEHLLKTGKPCCKPATFIYNQNLDKTDIYLCTSHSKHKSYSKVKKFKIRLTSKTSGKKIDVNVRFIHKHTE